MKNIFKYAILLSLSLPNLAQGQAVSFEVKNNTTTMLPRWVTQWFASKKQALKPVINADYQIEGLIGVYPTKVYWIIDQLKKTGDTLLSNRLILYGPPGNGKSTLARGIARKADCNFVSLNGPSVVGSYLGEGAQKIRELFEFAAEKYEKTGKKQVIFIDEIDAICRANINFEAAARAEHQVATQELWLSLDKYKHHQGIFFICATNHFDKLDRTFLDRFNTNTLEISNPDAPARRNILLHYLAQHSLKFDSSLLEEIVKNSEGLSIRTLEDLVQDIAISRLLYSPDDINADLVWELLRETKKKYNQPIVPKKSWQEFFSLGNHDFLSLSHNLVTLPLNALQLCSLVHSKMTFGSWSPTSLPASSSLPVFDDGFDA